MKNSTNNPYCLLSFLSIFTPLFIIYLFLKFDIIFLLLPVDGISNSDTSTECAATMGWVWWTRGILSWKEKLNHTRGKMLMRVNTHMNGLMAGSESTLMSAQTKLYFRIKGWWKVFVSKRITSIWFDCWIFIISKGKR